ncbi:MAG: thiamine pyrophosphate-binding protein [Candidatus Omnitrophota bacterium]
MKIKVSDYIARYLTKYGVRRVFMVTGGGAMHLNNSFGKNKLLKCIFMHHEQACAIAAEGYARVSGKLAVVNVTTGPGGLNTLTGVMGQWTDSVPVLYISGQVKSETTIASCPNIRLRQLGDQEVDIVSVVRPLTKFAATVRKAEDIRKLLDKAINLAATGRPGPVWLDIPLDIQGAVIEENNLIGSGIILRREPDNIDGKIRHFLELLEKSKRPVIVAGNGIRIAGAKEFLLALIRKLKVPVLSTFNGFDLVPSDNPYFIGRIGTLGSRAGNFALQNSDLVLCLGTRNNIRQVSYNWQSFAHAAKKVVVDIDSAELKKPTIKPDIAINCDAGLFLSKFLQYKISGFDCKDWLLWCSKRRDKYPVVLPEYSRSASVNPYYFMRVLTELARPGETIVTANATPSVVLFQAGIVKDKQRVIWNSGCAAMGYDLPASIGACIGNGNRDIICIAGDGSIQMNIQELQTIKYNKLPIKIFVLNNGGYSSIRQTQENFFGPPYVGCDKKSGVSFPSFVKVAGAFGIKAAKITTHKGMPEKILKIINSEGAILCEVMLETNYKFAPRLSSSKLDNGKIVSSRLEDMSPFLDRKEFKENIFIQEGN